jgi:hypothetical protein
VDAIAVRGVADNFTLMGASSPRIHHEVDLCSGYGPPEFELWVDAAVHEGLDDFGEHRSFHDITSHRNESGMLLIFLGNSCFLTDIPLIPFKHKQRKMGT